MVSRRQIPNLGFLFIVAVFAYHATNFWQFSRNNFHILSEISSQRMAANLNNLDYCLRTLRDSGYLWRFRAGQTGKMAEVGPARPFFYLGDRYENMFFYPAATKRVQDNFKMELNRLQADLTSHGIDFLAFVIPPKRALLRDVLPTLAQESIWQTRLPADAERMKTRNDVYRTYRDIIDANPKYITDLFLPYEKWMNEKAGDEPYIPWDLHWTSAGIALASKAVVEKLNEAGWDIGEPKIIFDHIAPLDFEHRLLRPLMFSQAYMARRPEFQWREKLYRMEVSHPSTKKTPGRLIYLGSSNGERHAGTPFSFANMMGKALGRETLDHAHSGGSNQGSLIRFVTTNVVLRPGDLVIWEVMLYGELKDGEKLPTLPIANRDIAGF